MGDRHVVRTYFVQILAQQFPQRTRSRIGMIDLREVIVRNIPIPEGGILLVAYGGRMGLPGYGGSYGRDDRHY